MFKFIKQAFNVLLSFSGSLTIKCRSLNDKPRLVGFYSY